MYRRIVILSVIILVAVGGLAWLGFRAIEIQADGLAGRRWGEFAAVAEQIRRDVNRKLDEFIQTEQERPYTDYQYYYVAENTVARNVQQQMPLLRSPLGSTLEHGLAYGHFQIEPDGTVTTPNYDVHDETPVVAKEYLAEIKQKLRAELNGFSSGIAVVAGQRTAGSRLAVKWAGTGSKAMRKEDVADEEATQKKSKRRKGKGGGRKRARSLAIKSLQKESQKVQVFQQSRSLVGMNVVSNLREGLVGQQSADANTRPSRVSAAQTEQSAIQQFAFDRARGTTQISMPSAQHRLNVQQYKDDLSESHTQMFDMDFRQAQDRVSAMQQVADEFSPADTVQIRIEPFVPKLVTRADGYEGMFGGEVFLLRHVQIENRHIIQGFKLDEGKLLEEVRESAEKFMREGMCFELSDAEDEEAAYTAILDFGFAEIVVNLMETDPGWIGRQIGQLRNWYFSIIAVVLVAVTLGLLSLWRNLQAQVKLTQKKDDFISAVSHELRTPLTSLRMYTEMLEKNWVKSEDKRNEYYRNMRQESERLSRLIENVLDFSRLQRNRKKYSFRVGDINQCVDRVVDMMLPYAEQAGFSVEKDLAATGQVAFDSDAVMQIVINLIDNAVKYARTGGEKKIIVRTRRNDAHVLIEVEDHGPGLAHRERKKVFDEFYRCQDELRQEVTGVGLGLTLVKKFAMAHDGFVEILTAKPSGAIFRVALAAQN